MRVAAAWGYSSQTAGRQQGPTGSGVGMRGVKGGAGRERLAGYGREPGQEPGRDRGQLPQQAR
ncbi:hypothetical protein GCM10010289_45550 [Streptomyces violascens]|uniref:Uncharacterized protein n=1 Tax=Streptomyces violascens TaxID=67381 RepID=A0ABQ3QXZ5_9ACTN|nr:hypothetical protein GCM10010289_45550 [Streptomyces violascens]GHI42147.1 hypothetical protein Sviol_65550 [Streptomyces violascens]